MKIAIAITATKAPAPASVSGHAGQSREWLLYDIEPGAGTPGRSLPPALRITLEMAQVLHHFDDSCPHPLDGVEIVVAGSAGDGFIRHMRKRGATVLLTGETDPAAALAKILAGEALPDKRFDVTTTLCKLRDLFSRH